MAALLPFPSIKTGFSKSKICSLKCTLWILGRVRSFPRGVYNWDDIIIGVDVIMNGLAWYLIDLLYVFSHKGALTNLVLALALFDERARLGSDFRFRLYS
jgi:hypothetical protein